MHGKAQGTCPLPGRQKELLWDWGQGAEAGTAVPLVWAGLGLSSHTPTSDRQVKPK